MINSQDSRTTLPQFLDTITFDGETGHIFLRKPVAPLKAPVILIRHGETDGNVRGVSQGLSNGPENQLNTVGKNQATDGAAKLYSQLLCHFGPQQLRKLLSNKMISLQTSPLGRAKATADEFSRQLFQETGVRLSAQQNTGIIEMNFGDADGLSLDDMQERGLQEALQMVHLYRTGHADVNFSGGESFLTLLRRAHAVIEEINTSFSEGDFVVRLLFTHGLMASALRTIVGDKDILGKDNQIEFRQRQLQHATPYWLPTC